MSKKSERPSSASRQIKASNMGMLDALQAFLRIVRRQLPIIVASIAMTSAIGLFYAATAARSYTAAAMLIADLKKLQLSQSFGEAAIDPVELESQVEVFKSDNVLSPVVKALRLADKPEFKAVGAWQKLVGTAIPITDQVASRRALEALRLSLGVARVGRTRVIEISYKAADPDFAAQVVNAAAESYIADQLEAKSESARQASAWLQARIADLARQASADEQAVVKFKGDNNIIDAGGGRLMNEQQLTEIASKLGNARAATTEARAKLERIEAILEKDRKDQNVNATVADTLKNEVVSELRTRYLALLNREADYAARYGADHLAVVNLRSQLLGIRRSIHEELQRLDETYKSDLAIARSKQEEIENEYAGAIANLQATSRAQVKLRELEGAARTARALYEHFVERNMEQVQQQSMRFSDTRLISPASAPLYPSQPKRLQAIVIAVLGGAALGLGIATLRDSTDRAFRTGEQVEKRLMTKCLALAPRLETNHTEPARQQADARRQGAVTSGQPWTAVIDTPYSRYAEEIHAVKLAVGVNGSTKSCKVIGITSALPGEGKSTTAINLARLVARNGGNTALVDCDLRNPRLGRVFAVGEHAGLSEVIVNHATLDETMHKDDLTELMVLSAGDEPRFAHPNEILASEAIGGLFERLRQLFEWVIVDLPPMGPVTDVRATTSFIDSYLLVIEWGRTDYACVEHALEKEPDVYDRLIGAVLNKVDVDRLPNYGGEYISQMNHYYNSMAPGAGPAQAA
jgi:succinoglycan biosynthesis transport protein ExoP